MGTKYNGLNRNKRPNPISPRKIAKLNAEVPERIKLAKRCGGRYVTNKRCIKIDGQNYILTTVKCYGGTCEICNQPAKPNEQLFPHESPKRSAGGKVSLKDSLMCHTYCHPISKPQLRWIR